MKPIITSNQKKNIIAIIPIPQPHHHMGCISQCHSYIRSWASKFPTLPANGNHNIKFGMALSPFKFSVS